MSDPIIKLERHSSNESDADEASNGVEGEHYKASARKRPCHRGKYLTSTVAKKDDNLKAWSDLTPIVWIEWVDYDRKLHKLRPGDNVTLSRVDETEPDAWKIVELRKDTRVDNQIVYVLAAHYARGRLTDEVMVFEHTSISSKLYL